MVSNYKAWTYFSKWRWPMLCKQLECIYDMDDYQDAKITLAHMKYEFTQLLNGHNLCVTTYDKDKKDWIDIYYNIHDVKTKNLI